MKTVGLITEYNPLHNGHVHHFNEAKRLSGAECAVVVMSGPFTQRGEPACVDKYARTEMALRMGADLVLELPVAYAVQPAEWFGFGAVSLLEATGVVDALCFGSEAGTLDGLLPLAERLAEESPELKQRIRVKLDQGLSFPVAYSEAAAESLHGEAAILGGEGETPGGEGETMPGDAAPGASSTLPHGLSPEAAAELLQAPNNRLGLHYLIALRKLGSGIVPLTIPRTGAGFHDPAVPGAAIASATAIRGLLQAGSNASSYLPGYTGEILRRERAAGRVPIGWEAFAEPLLHLLLTRTADELRPIQGMEEGLEHRLVNALSSLDTFSPEALLQAVKTKRYTRTRLQRLLVHVLLGQLKEEHTAEQLAGGPGYIRVLGFAGSGRLLLKRMRTAAALPVVLQPTALEHPQLTRDLQASAAYAARYSGASRGSLLRDYLQPPVIL
ncbi:nucleotidyltransferase family protein [Paenibacillus sp. CN-4]|uniref:tRNA(Met) cytidine acetate ligase n=1 Tax=Paenibacillus nanchangensis TaxID=3348343 RepID=UPI0039789AAB